MGLGAPANALPALQRLGSFGRFIKLPRHLNAAMQHESGPDVHVAITTTVASFVVPHM